MDDINEDLIKICLKSPIFQTMAISISDQLKKDFLGDKNPWLDEKEAMSILRITSKTTFQKYREEGNIEHRRLPGGKKILYRKQSVMGFIENSPKE